MNGEKPQGRVRVSLISNRVCYEIRTTLAIRRFRKAWAPPLAWIKDGSYRRV